MSEGQMWGQDYKVPNMERVSNLIGWYQEASNFKFKFELNFSGKWLRKIKTQRKNKRKSIFRRSIGSLPGSNTKNINLNSQDYDKLSLSIRSWMNGKDLMLRPRKI